MSDNSTEHRLAKVISDILGVENPVPADSFVDNLRCDSLDTVELMIAVEEEFGVQISDADAEKWVTVGDAIKGIDELRMK